MDDALEKSVAEKAQSLVRITDEGAKVTHTWEKLQVIMHMTAVISCNKMWNDQMYLLHTFCKAGQHDYIVFLYNGYYRF